MEAHGEKQVTSVPADDPKRIAQLIEQVRQIIAESIKSGLSWKLYLFGSRAHGKALAHADIDLALSCEKLSEKEWRVIKRRIGELRTLYTIDLLHVEGADGNLRRSILNNGKLIYG